MKYILVLVLIFCSLIISAQVRLDNMFQSHMVLQREKPIRIYGIGVRYNEVAVRLGNIEKSTIVNESGNWEVVFPSQNASFDPIELKINDSILLEDILIGDVWLFFGQSNMGISLAGCNLDSLEFKGDNEYLRLCKVSPPRINFREGISDESLERMVPDRFFEVDWERNSQSTKSKFSAVGWLTAARLCAQTYVPIGAVQVAIGGSAINNWVSPKWLKQIPEGQNFFKGNWLKNPNANRHHILQALGAFQNHHVDSTTYWKVGQMPFRWYREPGFLYESFQSVMKEFPMKGMVWYQGESDVGIQENIKDYPVLFKYFLSGIRNGLRQDLPIYVVQLPGLERANWDLFRLAQKECVDQSQEAHLIVTFDTGGKRNLHPKDKIPVGHRTAQIILANQYKKSNLKKFPKVKKVTKIKSGIYVYFDQKVIIPGNAFGFDWVSTKGTVIELSGKLISDSILYLILPSDSLGPGTLRYGISSFPSREVFIYNQDQLPLGPFEYEFPK